MSDHAIFIRPEPEQGYRVSVEPTTDYVLPDEVFPTVRQARGCASGIRLVMRWPIIDLCGGRAGD